MRKIKLHKISYKCVGFPTFLYDKTYNFILTFAYTIGNITPVNNNPHADYFDSWEYKLFVSDSINYTGDYVKYFIYDSYYKEKKKWWEDFQNSNDKKKVILEYMDSRVNLIKQRGKA